MDALVTAHDASWHGQVAEFAVWNSVLVSGRGRIHVLLPTEDRGVDGLAYDPVTERFVALQVKARSGIDRGEIELLIHDAELRDPEVRIVLVRFAAETMEIESGAWVFTVREFLENSEPLSAPGPASHQAYVPVETHLASRWDKYRVELSAISERLFGAEIAALEMPAESVEDADARVRRGKRGELQALLLLAGNSDLSTFHAFPDDDFVEYAVRHVGSGAICGLQIKTGRVGAGRDAISVVVEERTFRAASNVYVLVLCEDDAGFGDVCWLIPATDIPKVASLSSGHYEFRVPVGDEESRFGVYRVRASELGDVVEARLRG